MNSPKILITLALLISSLPLFAQDAGTNAVTTQPQIPEEARKHFVMGETMFKEAKSVDNFTLAAGEFKQVADLAPQWPEARYDLALAKEAAGNYSGALDDLKIYQQFKLSDNEARTAQDKIYAIQAKQQMQASDTAAKAAADAANAQAASDSAKKQQTARPISLICNTGNSSDVSPTILDLNEAEGAVTIHYSAVHNPGGTPDPMPAHAPVTIAAKFEHNTITFEENDGFRVVDYTINRLTGSIDRMVTQDGQQFHFTWTSSVGNPQF